MTRGQVKSSVVLMRLKDGAGAHLGWLVGDVSWCVDFIILCHWLICYNNHVRDKEKNGRGKLGNGNLLKRLCPQRKWNV